MERDRGSDKEAVCDLRHSPKRLSVLTEPIFGRLRARRGLRGWCEYETTFLRNTRTRARIMDC